MLLKDVLKLITTNRMFKIRTKDSKKIAEGYEIFIKQQIDINNYFVVELIDKDYKNEDFITIIVKEK